MIPPFHKLFTTTNIISYYNKYISTILGINQSIFRKEKEMAQQSSSTALKELDEQLTCNVCLDQYTNPKTLPCLHSFCLKCIVKLPQEQQVQTHTHTHNLVLLTLHCLYIILFTNRETSISLAVLHVVSPHNYPT